LETGRVFLPRESKGSPASAAEESENDHERAKKTGRLRSRRRGGINMLAG
jgi:hypothetical protein